MNPLIKNKTTIIRERGFTLVELLIVCIIIGIMTAVILVSLQGNHDQKAVETEGRKLAATLREVQNNALTGKLTGQTPSPTLALCYAEFQVDSSTNPPTYSEYQTTRGAACPAPADLKDATLTPINTFKIGNTVSMGDPGIGKKIFFSAPFGHIFYFDSGTSYPEYTIASGSAMNYVLTKGSANFTVCLCPAGKVVEVSGTTNDGCKTICQIQ